MLGAHGAGRDWEPPTVFADCVASLDMGYQSCLPMALSRVLTHLASVVLEVTALLIGV